MSPVIARILKNSIALSVGILLIYIRTYYRYTSITAQTAALVTWLLGHILLALNLKQEKVPSLVQGFFSNRFGIFWLLSMILFSLTITTVAYVYPYLKTTWLPFSLWAEIVIIACLSTFWIEIKKIVKFKKAKSRHSRLNVFSLYYVYVFALHVSAADNICTISLCPVCVAYIRAVISVSSTA